MVKVDIFSGFLGAGKTTLIKKLLSEAFSDEKIVLIENEFGDIGIDGTFMQEAGVMVNEMNSGCICCSLVGDFSKAVEKVINEYGPDRIIIEPSGVGKLSDVIMAVEGLMHPEIQLNGFVTVADARKCKMYMKNFGEFYNNQVESCDVIILSHTQDMKAEDIEKTVALLREHNESAAVITTDWDKLTGSQILDIIEKNDNLKIKTEKLMKEVTDCHGHHHHDGECCGDHGHGHHHHEGECCGDHGHGHHHHDGECCGEHGHGHHHHHDEECCGDHGHSHHHHDGECCGEHGHGHHHHHDGECCGEHGHAHEHGHHHASDVFTSVGMETTKRFSQEQLNELVSKLNNSEEFGQVLRAKGVVEGEDGQWIHFDYVPGDVDIRPGTAGVIGMICVIGAEIQESKIKALFLG